MANIKGKEEVTTASPHLKKKAFLKKYYSQKNSPAAPCCNLYKGVIRLQILS